MAFKLCGVEICVGFFFAAAVTFFFTLDAGAAAVTLLSAALHEAGHIAALTAFSEPPRELKLMPFGVRIKRKGGVGLSFPKETVVALAGPAANLAAVAVCRNFAGLERVCRVNTALALFNLLPIEPLDGSAALYNVLCMVAAEKTAARVRTAVSVCVLFPVAAQGFRLLLNGAGVSALAVVIYVMAYLITQTGRGSG